MQQHDRIAFAGDEIVQPDAVDFGEFALRDLGESLALTGQGNRQQKRGAQRQNHA